MKLEYDTAYYYHLKWLSTEITLFNSLKTRKLLLVF